MPSLQLHVETITFRGSGVNALPLLVGQVPVTGSEWTRSGTRLPAAFVVATSDTHVSIRATFSSPDLAGQTTIVFASRLDGTGHVLQEVAPAPVTFDATGRSGDVQLRVAVSGVGIDRDRVRWHWKVRVNGQEHGDTITEHDIAVVLGHPQQPWTTATPAPADTSLPWWEVLHRASTEAVGATTLDAAARRLTDTAFSKWGLTHYKWNSGAETFASDSGDTPRAFDCARFLSLLAGPPPAAKEIVDCSDIATIVSTFAAILGCPVQQLTLFIELRCKILKKVGHDSWEAGVGFPLHEVGVSFPPGSNPLIWDGCVMLSDDATIGPGEPTSASLPAGIEAPAYVSKLLRTTGTAFEDHLIPGLSGPLVRPIGALSNLLATLASDQHLESLAPPVVEVVHGLPAPPFPPPPAGVVRTFDPMALAGGGWNVLIEMAFPSPDMVKSDADAVARMVCTWHNDPRRRVRVNVYLCPNAAAARRRLAHMLGKFTPPLTRFESGSEDAFRSDDGKAILGVTMNVAYKIIDGGEGPVATTPDASRFQDVLTKSLASASAPL
jgi:hypothetical protein